MGRQADDEGRKPARLDARLGGPARADGDIPRRRARRDPHRRERRAVVARRPVRLAARRARPWSRAAGQRTGGRRMIATLGAQVEV